MNKYVKKIIYFAACLTIVLICCTGCKQTEYVEVPVETVRTEYVHKTDSFYQHDSIWTLIEKKGDTVFVDKYKEKFRYITKTDTINKTDTITKVLHVTKVVEVNKLKKWQKILMLLGGGFLVSLITIIIYKIKKWR